MRFKALYEKEKEYKKEYYSEFLVDYAKKNKKLLLKVEKKIKIMLNKNNKSIAIKVLKSKLKSIEFLHQLLTYHYKLEIALY